MQTKKTPQEQAVERFVFHIQNSRNLCDAIKQHLDDHFGVNPDEVNWSDVGSAEHVSELLKEITEFLQIKVEE